LKKIIFITFALIASLNTQAQVNLDSLFNIWKASDRSDSVRIKAYEEYIRKGFLFSQPDSAFNLSNKLQSFAETQNYPRAQVLADNLKSIVRYLQGDYSEALKYNKLSLELSERIASKDMTASSLNLFGLIYEKQGYYSTALDYHQRSLKLSEELEDKRRIAFSLNNIGEILNTQGASEKALDYFERSLALLEELDLRQWMANALMNIGLCYAYQGNHSVAFNYYHKSLNYYEAVGDKRGIVQCLHVIGKAYYQQKDISQALTYFQRSLKISEEIDYMRGAILAITDIGNSYFYQENYTSSLEYCKQSYELSKSIGALELQRDACNCIYMNYKATANKALALSYLEEFNALDDSLKRQETVKAVQQMEFDFKTLQDSIIQAEQQRLVKEAFEEEVSHNKRIRNLFVGLGFFFLMIAGGYYSRWKYVRRSKAIIEKEKDRADRLLLNILPEEIAVELKEKGKADAREFEKVAVLFTDFVGFTSISEKLSAIELVDEINDCFETFDMIIEKYHIEKIKTIGDAYMAVGGIPVTTEDAVQNTVLAAIDMQKYIIERKALHNVKDITALEMRVGIHTGPVVAGIVGKKKFQYDIWGDTVNTASRLENVGEAGKVNISKSTFELIKDNTNFKFTSRGKIKVKGKEDIEMWFVEKCT